MQLTETITADGAASAHLVLNLHAKNEERVRALLVKMKEAVNGISFQHQKEVLQALSEWETFFFKSYKIDSRLDREREAAAHALLFLKVSHIEYSIIGYAEALLEKIQWVQFSNEIKNIVTSILPSNHNVDAFIEADKKKQLDVRMRFKVALVIKEMMPLMMATCAELEDKLYNSVTLVNQNLQQEFEEIKSVLANLNDNRSVTMEELHQEMNNLTEKITKIYQDLEQQLNETKELGQQIKIKDTGLTHLLQTIETVISKV